MRERRFAFFLMMCFTGAVALVSVGCGAYHRADPAVYPAPATDYWGRRTQQRLAPERAEVAVVFVGGFAEPVLTRVRAVYERMPVLPLPGKQYRAFYAWDGGSGSIFAHSTRVLQGDLQAFLKVNPHADLIFVGHSYGGSAVMDALRHIGPVQGRVLVVTLDPVSRRERSAPRDRAPGIDYWINVYCDEKRTLRDAIVSLGGPWGHCPQADENYVFLGTLRDARGKRFQHAYPEPLFYERMPGQRESAYERLVDVCRRWCAQSAMQEKFVMQEK